ncbi:MAG: DNA polymerase IV [Treponema sp.]|jgi:DNA polymerase-4|nr:DNA polymerase IV [Treponema sp.]
MPCFIHADLDAFYASVEQLDHSEYRGKPVIVGGIPGDRRSVVAAASYEARSFGVHSAMPLAEAVRLCPRGIFLRGRMDRYREKSHEIMGVFGSFSPDVQQLSIDEAFLDISGTEGLFGPPAALAKKLKERIRAETGLTVSVGIAENKYIAKIASGLSKPDGLSVIENGTAEKFMRALPVGKIWGAGPKTQELFKKHSLTTGEDLYRLSEKVLAAIFGDALGLFLYRAVRGEAAAAFNEERGSRSMSAERTFAFDLYDTFAMETALFDICQDLIWRLLDCRWYSRTISVKIRYADFSTESGRKTFENPVRSFNELYERLLDLFRQKYRNGRGVRLLGAGLMNLETQIAHQGELFDGEIPRSEKERHLEETILEINKKFPRAALQRGRSCLKEP